MRSHCILFTMLHSLKSLYEWTHGILKVRGCIAHDKICIYSRTCLVCTLKETQKLYFLSEVLTIRIGLCM